MAKWRKRPDFSVSITNDPATGSSTSGARPPREGGAPPRLQQEQGQKQQQQQQQQQQQPPPTEQQQGTSVSIVDGNSDGLISREEFVSAAEWANHAAMHEAGGVRGGWGGRLRRAFMCNARHCR